MTAESPTTESPTNSELPFGWNDHTFDDIHKVLLEKTYTHFVVDQDGFWYCPKCRWKAQYGHRWAFKVRGYAKLPEDALSLAVHASYGGDHPNGLYFKNPAKVVQCQNHWNTGLSGSRCTFNREKVEGHRDEAMEKEHDQGGFLGFCPQCSVTPDVLERNPAFNAYVQSEQVNKKGVELLKQHVHIFALHNEDPWFGKPRWMRQFWYDYTEESLKCPTKHFGEGGGEGKEDTPCPGRYGGPVVFYNRELEEELGQNTEMVETGQSPDESEMNTDNKTKVIYSVEWTPDETSWEGSESSSGSEKAPPMDFDDSTTSSSEWSSYGQQSPGGYASS
ncbi:hypothetical protein N0V83_004478 [Neocucurbitaria cava]|uniref:Uncharacterized protein n=1 Tax=Neocucurbitaria cava TaxID=798079 RepID=A0A9W8Y9R1_9PLEO|nr:hypothetical protein N0V83_004478 [Neocucurbitaria cava]